jgi:hypothetical protein
MEIKSLLDPTAKKEIILRIQKLNPQSPAQWGKMNVSQMLAHLQMPLGVAIGTHKLKRTMFGRIFGPMPNRCCLIPNQPEEKPPYRQNLCHDR